MSYNKTIWSKGDTITAQKLNNIESGIENSFTFLDQLKGVIDKSITSLTIPAGTTKIGDSIFAGYTSLKTVTIPSSVTSIERYAFAGCASLKTVTIPSGVTSIGEHAFSGCTALKAATIQANVTTIGDNMFSGCVALETVTIPSGVTSIGSSFSGCISLNSMYLYSNTPPTVASGALGGVPETCNIYVPAASVSAYKASSGWSSRAAYIQAMPE
jgi:hypothetical protein